ncbi:hypothetical protein FB446DRAFT_373524 [Lentinula raphanica]|nr:hypothetical protein FB446DRAFT_373524 [Lentinula raphanica]
MFIPIGIVYLAFGLLTSTHGAPLYPTTATGRPVLKSEELAMGDDVTPSSLVRRHVRRPFNYTVNTHGQDLHSDSDWDSDSDSDSDSELDLDEANLRRPRDPLPPMELVSLIWFSSEAQPSSPLHTRTPWYADVYPDTEEIILSAVRQKAPWAVATVINSSGLYYLERSIRSDRSFYFEFYFTRHDDFHPISIEGGGPFNGTIPDTVPAHSFETHVWFTEVGRRRGPTSDVRLFSRQTGLTHRTVTILSNQLHKSVFPVMPELNHDEHIMVFREECQPKRRRFHLQTFRRDHNKVLVASKHGGPYTGFLYDACDPHTGSVRLPLPSPTHRNGVAGPLLPPPPPPSPPRPPLELELVNPPPLFPPKVERPLSPSELEYPPFPSELERPPSPPGLERPPSPPRPGLPPPRPPRPALPSPRPPRPALPPPRSPRPALPPVNPGLHPPSVRPEIILQSPGVRQIPKVHHDSDYYSESEEDESPTDSLVSFVWFSSEAQPNSTQRTRSSLDADVFTDTQNLIWSAMSEKSTQLGTTTHFFDVYFLERLIRRDRHFYFQFYRIPHNDPRPVSIEGGGPFNGTLPEKVPPHSFETHVWFTDVGIRRGPNSDVRLFSGDSGLSYRNAILISREVHNSVLSVIPDLNDDHTMVFRERCLRGQSHFHSQTFRRDQDNVLVAIQNGGRLAGLTGFLPQACDPRNGTDRFPLPRPRTNGNDAPLLEPVSSRPGLASSPPSTAALPPRPPSPPLTPVSPPLTPVSPHPKLASPLSRPASPEPHADENDASSSLSPKPHTNTNSDASPPRAASTGPHVDRNDARPLNAASHKPHTDKNGTPSRRPASPGPHINANLDASPPRIASPGPHVHEKDVSASGAASSEPRTDENGTPSPRPASPRPHDDASSPRPASPGPHNNKNGAV